MNHYESAEQLQGLADEAAKRADFAMAEDPGDPLAPVPGLLGALVYLIAAQTHATLAVVDVLDKTFTEEVKRLEAQGS